ncbi:hypothetical protein J6590_030138 [Homalodisca vitripennis]|nr:hypothetical protein J6590_030138 [Homalodisca vitripennis]
MSVPVPSDLPVFQYNDGIEEDDLNIYIIVDNVKAAISVERSECGTSGGTISVGTRGGEEYLPQVCCAPSLIGKRNSPVQALGYCFTDNL